MNDRLRLTAVCGVATLLGSAPLGPLFDSWQWLKYAFITVAVITAAGALARRLGVPDGLVPLANLAALTLLVSIIFGTGAEIYGVLPTGGTVDAIHTQLSGAFIDIVQLAVPVPPRRGLLLLTVLGVGAVAILVDALTVSLRRSALAGLPLLAMFAVPVAVVRDGIGWLPFACGAAGYLLLLISEGRDRMNRWGRPFAEQAGEESWRPDPLEGSPVAAVGRRIGAAAISVAVVVPALLPFVHAGGLAGGTGDSGDGNGAGSGAAAPLNPLTALRGQLRRERPLELLRVKTSDPRPFYLRVTTLDIYTPAGWKQDSLSGSDRRVAQGLPDPGIGAGVPTTKVSTRVEVRGLTTSQYLPVYAAPTRVDVKGDWRFDRPSGTVFTTRTNTRELNYHFSSVAPDQSSAALVALLKQSPAAEDSMQAAYGSGNVPPAPEIVSRVKAIVGAATRTPYEKTEALYEYFRSPGSGFQYTTSTKPGNSGSDLLDFLINKQGYCEQYASAMAVMARYAGVPARVAIGYTKGQRKAGYWSISTRDAHAWVEVYFQGVGWVPWDPTPLGTGGRATTLPYAGAASDSQTGPRAAVPGATNPLSGSAKQQLLTLKDRESRLTDRPIAANLPSAAVVRQSDHRRSWALAGGLAVLALLAPAAGRWLQRRRRLRRAAGGDLRVAAHAAWDEVLATAYDVGLDLDEAETPRATAARLTRRAHLDEPAGAALRQLAANEERARYAREPRLTEGLVVTVRVLRGALLADAERGTRLQARAFPPSAISGASRRGGSGLSDALDRIDKVLAQGRRAVLTRLAPPRSS